MAIISVLLGLSTVAISGVSKGRNLDNAGNFVMNLAQQARQNSLTKNSLTALVLASAAPDTGFSLRIFCLMELAPGATGWTRISPWQILPEGVVVDSDHSAAFFQTPDITPAVPDIPFRGATVTAAVYQIFTPDGSLYVGSNGKPAASPALKLVQGVIAPDGSVQYTASGGTNPNNYYEISLNALTGISRVTRL